MSIITTFFWISIILMLLVAVSRYFGFSFLRRYDSMVQSFMTRISRKTLRFLNQTREFILVHFYEMSSGMVKGVFEKTTQRSEGLLEKLKGSTPRLSRQRVSDDVSPYLREISKIDRRLD